MIEFGSIAPDFTLPISSTKTLALRSLRGNFVLLVFYPGDNTPVCVEQLCNYRDQWHEFTKRGIAIVGMSPDEINSHIHFAKQFDFPFPLVSDPDKTTIAKYKILGFGGMVQRGFLLIDPDGIVVWGESNFLPVFYRKAAYILDKVDTFIAMRSSLNVL